MNIVLWVLASLLAVVFLGAGGSKLAQLKAKLAADPRMAWTEDFQEGQLKGIGAVEVLGALGLVLPAALGIAEVLTPLAAAGLAVTMVGAVATHARRGEKQAVVPPAVLGVLLVVLAVLRFGPYSF